MLSNHDYVLAAAADELQERRRRLMRRVPPDALVLVRGATPEPGQRRFRQANDFYYLTGVETPGAYLLLDAAAERELLYLPHRDAQRERVDGPQLSCEDQQAASSISGITQIAGPERLPADLAALLFKRPRRLLVPLAPQEAEATTRDSALAATAWEAADPFSPTTFVARGLVDALQGRFGQLEIGDLSPHLDACRLLKSPHEIKVMRAAARLCGLAVLEAMRSTAPGVYEYQLEAVADFVFRQGGARGAGYAAIVAGGRNAWFGHYSANAAALADGDLVLMDYAPDLAYYTSDIGRMWPVNGRYNPWQRELYGFVVDYHAELLARIGPGRTAAEILAGASEAMRARIEAQTFSKPTYRAAAEAALVFPGHLSHPVGMAVHDVGDYRAAPLEPGLVFSVDPMIWVPEEELYVRVEDTVVVTNDGVENLTGFVPLALDEVEQTLEEPGLLQWWSSRS